MKTLLILRHAKSSWKNPELADHDRPLSRRGKRDAPRMGNLLEDEGLMPDLIISSTAKRAQKTVKVVAKSCGYNGEFIFTRDLFHALSDEIIEILREIPAGFEIVMIVGHNPGLEELLDLFTGAGEWLPTAALAQVSLMIDQWSELSYLTEGRLVNIWRPRDVN